MNSFAELFKKLRLLSDISSLRDLCDMLSNFNLNIEESTLSRWQNGSRVPRNREHIITLIKIFALKGAIKTVKEANSFLQSANCGALTSSEERQLSLKHNKQVIFSLPPEPNLFGTDHIYDEIANYLVKDSGHLRVLLWGLPGSGKSTTAITIGHKFQSHFSRGIIWIQVLDSSIESVISIIEEIIASNLISEVEVPSSNFYKSKDFLFIFDNVGTEECLTKIIHNFTYSSYIVTTALQPQLDNHFRLIKMENFVEKYVLEFFSRAAGRSLSKKEKTIAKEIGREVGNLPLPLAIITNTLQSQLNEESLAMTLSLLRQKKAGMMFFKENFAQIISAFDLLFEQLQEHEKLLLKTLSQKKLTIFRPEDLVDSEQDLIQVKWILFTLSNRFLFDKTGENEYRIHPVLFKFLQIKFELA